MASNANNFVWAQNVTAPRAPRISPAQWDRHHTKIVQLHNQGKTKQEISQIMARDCGFEPTPHQYTTQFEKWDLRRYKSNKMPNEQSSIATQSSGVRSTVQTQLRPIQSPNERLLEALPPDGESSIQPTSTIDAFHLSAGNTSQQPTTPDLEIQSGVSEASRTQSALAETPSGFVKLNSSLTPISTDSGSSSTDAPCPFISDPATGVTRNLDTKLAEHAESINDPFGDSSMEFSRDSMSITISGIDRVESDDDSIGQVTASMRTMSMRDPFRDENDSMRDYSSVWVSTASQSQISLLTQRSSLTTTTLPDRSKALPHDQYLAQLYPNRKLRRLRNFAKKFLAHNWSAADSLIESILSQADFFRVSLSLSDAFDLYLLAYILLTDKKIKASVVFDNNFIMEAIMGCAESAQNLSQVRLCQHFLTESGELDNELFLTITGFPLQYVHGHLAVLERRSDYAALCMQQAVSGLGVLRFNSSAAVTAPLVHQLYARHRQMNLAFDKSTAWLKHAQSLLRSGEFPCTVAAAVRTLLNWSISKLEKEDFDSVIKDCFPDHAIASMTNSNGHQVPQDTVMLVVYLCCAWGEENDIPDAGLSQVSRPTASVNRFDGPFASIDKVTSSLNEQQDWRKRTSPGQEALELISKEIDISLMSILTTLSRMITEQSVIYAGTDSGSDRSTRIKENAVRLSQLSGEDLEKAFTRAYFFVNTRAPELGYGLHPQRYLRAVAIYNLPHNLVASEIGPDWLKATPTIATSSYMSGARLDNAASTATPSGLDRRNSIRSSLSSTRPLLYDAQRSGLPQPSPRSSISLKIRDALRLARKRKYPPSVNSQQSHLSRNPLPAKVLKNDTTGGTSGSEFPGKNEAEKEWLAMFGLRASMASLQMRDPTP